MRLLIRQASGLCLGAIILVGCGGPAADRGVAVKGKLLKNGQPAEVDFTGKLPPGDSGRMRVTLYPVKNDTQPVADAGGETLVEGAETAIVESDGTFRVDVKPGKYRIVVTHVHPSTGKDALKGVFNEVNSKITRDVTTEQEIVIDLAKPGG